PEPEVHQQQRGQPAPALRVPQGLDAVIPPTVGTPQREPCNPPPDNRLVAGCGARGRHSWRMTAVPVSERLPMNSVTGSHVTREYGTTTETLTASPGTAVLTLTALPLTWMVGVVFGTPVPVRVFVTVVATVSLVLPESTATRAPLRAALLRISNTIMARPI